jgi:hypothetical protein
MVNVSSAGPALFLRLAGRMYAAGEAKSTETVLMRAVVWVVKIVWWMALEGRGRKTVVVKKMSEVLVIWMVVI